MCVFYEGEYSIRSVKLWVRLKEYGGELAQHLLQHAKTQGAFAIVMSGNICYSNAETNLRLMYEADKC